jgi:hypothetical protein
MSNDAREGKESVLSRWSRRKRDAEQATIDTEAAAVEVAMIDAPPLTDADMPDVETLTEESDFSAFMSPGVSDELRNLALRKLFRAPVFNIRDGLDEYDEDYTSFEKLGDIVTCDMKHQVEMQEKKLREAMEQEAEAIEDADLDDIEAIDDAEGDDTEVDDADDESRPASKIHAADTTTDPTET